MASYPKLSFNSSSDIKQPLLSTSTLAKYSGYNGRIVSSEENSSIAKTTRFLDDLDNYDYKCGLSPVRRMFCLLALFDFLFVFLMWIIYAQLFSTGLQEEFKQEVLLYHFDTSLFDLVCCALLRTLCLGVVYALLRSNKWYMVGLTTGGSTIFIIVKVFKVGKALSHGQPMSYLLLIVSFIICWSEVWHFDFQVIPTELKHAKKSLTSSMPAFAAESGKSYGSWQSRTFSEVDQRSFYTANAISEPVSDVSDSDDSCLTVITDCSAIEQPDKKKQYINQGKEVVKQAMRMLFISDGWKLERQETDDICISSREFDDIGKVFKCWARIDCPTPLLQKVLWDDLESQPSWNTGIVESRVVARLDKDTELCYILASEAAGGLIKPRDFVTVRRRRRKGNLWMNCGISTISNLAPEKKGIIRGENGPGGFILKDLSETGGKTEFTWLVNTHLKGWIPQKVIDQTMSGILVDTVRSLRELVCSLPQV